MAKNKVTKDEILEYLDLLQRDNNEKEKFAKEWQKEIKKEKNPVVKGFMSAVNVKNL